MRIIKDDTLTGLLRGMSKVQCEAMLSNLTAALKTLSTQDASLGKGPIFQPLRSGITTAEGNVSLFMPASTTAITGVKVVTLPKRGNIRGVINIFSPDGALKGLLSAVEITAFRTALATMSLLTRCKTIKVNNVVIFGAGKQAEWHARLVTLLFPGQVDRIHIVNRTAGRLDILCDILAEDLSGRQSSTRIERLSLEGLSELEYSNSIKSIIAEADVICCCTPSIMPLFAHADLGLDGSKSIFISLIGSYMPHMQEIDKATLLSGGSKIYVDSRDGCLHESGEIINARVDGSQLIELGECVGDIMSQPGENIIFKCVGMAIMDVVVAQDVLDIAVEVGVGDVIDGF
ncbi:hypothetical protein NQ176_g2258 [Zarea fungicola]|uniref:Uncharacterized protein n=1 Tax=Zarea fungicola TaxID=93591 RepID=A0ACC1NP64_9HYPO|nr:hypothetical protein NQ176_g2258 [Lecanicillium fungicola]